MASSAIAGRSGWWTHREYLEYLCAPEVGAQQLSFPTLPRELVIVFLYPLCGLRIVWRRSLASCQKISSMLLGLEVGQQTESGQRRGLGLFSACSATGRRPAVFVLKAQIQAPELRRQFVQDGARSSQAAEPGSPCAPGAVRLDAQLCLGQGAAERCLGSCSSGRGRTSPGPGRRAPERGHPLVLGSGHRHAPRRDRERCAAGVLRQPPPRLGGRRWFKQEGSIGRFYLQSKLLFSQWQLHQKMT